MKFIIQKKDLARLLRVLRTGNITKARRSLLRLAAHDGQLFLHAHNTEVGCEALVLDEGVCFFRPTQLLPLLRTYARTASLTVEVTPEGIQIGSTKISRGLWEVSLFENHHAAPLTLSFIPPKNNEPSDDQSAMRFTLP